MHTLTTEVRNAYIHTKFVFITLQSNPTEAIINGIGYNQITTVIRASIRFAALSSHYHIKSFT